MISHNIDEALFLSDNIVILSEKPTTVANIIKNELPKQQRSNLTTSPMFNELRDRVITALRYKI
jgi:ABC-type nitrate/sulfonate/bicarbonate transport system ATPase subunit